jgi:hypothetical protein
VARLHLANAVAGIRNAFGAGGQLRAKNQLSAMVDAMLQLVGNANVAPGNAEPADPLNSPFVLYVNPYTGSDRFVAGSYNWFEEPAGASTEAIIAAKLRRLENQRLVCGFSPQRPFKTINRAIIEAAIITSKNWYISDPLAHLDCVCIVLSPALHIVYNNPSTDGDAIAVGQWADNFEPTPEHLISFNPSEGGVLVPRGASLVSLTGDLRHTILRPSWVPSGNVDEIPTYANGVASYNLRRQIFKATGGGYAFGLTFRDKLNHLSSHHLLSAFGHATQAELNAFYGTVWTACGSGGNLSQAYLAARGTEYQIAAPISGSPGESWDSTNSASFYIFQCSVRSDLGMGRLWADGAKVEGFKSFVMANFTGVSLQKNMPFTEGSNQNDMRCWQKYANGEWVPVSSYADYISQTPDNIRPNPLRRSIGVGAINEAFIQKVSIFDIGEAVQSFVDAGGEIDSNNGNSSFGGCAGLARGYRAAALPQDRSWQLSAVRVPLSPGEKSGNIQRYYLGSVAAITSSTITLSSPLAPFGSSSTVPELLGRRGYSLPPDSFIWIENPQGVDWRAPASAQPWSSTAPALLNLSSPATDPSGNPIELAGNGVSLAIGSRVYVRRLVDTRTPAERRLSLLLSNTTKARIPSAHYVLQTDPASVSIARPLSSSELILATTTGVGSSPTAGVLTTAEVTVRRGGTPVNYANGTFYRAGTVVLHAAKHWINSQDLTTAQATPDPRLWQQTYVHMESGFAPEDNLRNEAPVLVFDVDTDGAEVTTTCGINWTTVWSAAASIHGQYRSGVDYLGAHLLLTAMGYSPSEAHAALIPRSEARRDRNPALTSSPANTLALSAVTPAGGAATGAANWALEWRRPSTLWMGGHRWFTSGAGNYSKAVPRALQDMGAQNRFTYLFTGQAGGRVIPQGSQEDGLLVSPRGLEDVATGVVQSVENLGTGDINTTQSDERANLTITSQLTVEGSADFEGPVTFEDVAAGQTTKLGPLKLAQLTELQKIGSAASIATNDAAINAEPRAVNVPGLNAWKLAQRLVSVSTGEIFVYVKSTAPDRDLNSMLEDPPTTKQKAIPTLARASEYLNQLLAGSEQTGVVRIAAVGLYDPGSYWYCNVRFEAWNETFTAMPFPSSSVGTASVPNNYYDGTGYGNFTAIPHFVPWKMFVFDVSFSGGPPESPNLFIGQFPSTLFTAKSVAFVGGFAMLGLTETIKAVADGLWPKASFIHSGSSNWLGVPAQDKINGLAPSGNLSYQNTSTNVDALLNSLRIATGFTGDFASVNYTPVFSIGGGDQSSAKLYDLILGPGLPGRKDFPGAYRSPYIAVRDNVPLGIANLYLRGNTTITSDGIGCTNNLTLANYAHYGTAAVPTPWIWRQFYHTLIAPTMPGVSINLDHIGGYVNGRTGMTVNALRSNGPDVSYYTDLFGKLLPNSIHLISNASTSIVIAYPTNQSDVTMGPYLDQVIHARFGMTVVNAFFRDTADKGTGQVWAGWVGKFGSNGHNNTKTRGVILGSAYGNYLQPEGSCSIVINDTVVYKGSPVASVGLFMRAGANLSNFTTYTPGFTAGLANYGEGNPTGNNPVITSADPTADLNIALRSWAAGISPQYGSTINTNVVL